MIPNVREIAIRKRKALAFLPREVWTSVPLRATFERTCRVISVSH